jgi:hypothetical protein
MTHAFSRGRSNPPPLLLAAAIAALFVAMPASAAGWLLGGVGGGGLNTAVGGYLDAKGSQLVTQGSSSLASPGTIQALPFGGWTAGLFAETDLLPWLSLRVEPRAAALGAARLALTDTGSSLDRYGASLYAVLVPVMLRGRLPAGPGSLVASLGPLAGFVLGWITLSDQYASAATTTTINQGLLDRFFTGGSAGLGYALPLGPGVASVEARADMAFTSAARDAGSGGAHILPIAFGVVASYGVRLGGGGK